MKKLYKFLVPALLMLVCQTVYAQTCSKYIGGYVPYYRNASASNIDYSRVSDVFYAFAGSDSTGALIVQTDPYVPTGNLDTFINATSGKNRYLSLEGGNSHSVRDMAYSATARSAFVTNCVNFCQSHSFQGIDLDWENIQSSADAARFDSLVGSLATALHSNGYKLVITLSYGNYNAGYYALATVSKADWIQLMAYDQTGWGSGSPFGNPSTYQMALDAVAYWQSRGYTDLSKMVIGVPFYGNRFTSTSGGYAPAVTYASIMNANPNLKTDVDQDSLTFFNSAALIRRKIEYTKFNGLKGIMIWELGQDLPSTNTKSLLRAVSDAACDQNPFWSDYSTPCNTNVAAGKPVDVSSGSSTAARLTDNNITTVWTSAATDTEWVSVNLGAVYNICAVEIVWDNTGIGRDFQIKTSLNDTSWQVVDQRSYNSSLVSTLQGLSATGKYLGFQGITRSSCNSRYKIAEIRVYGSLAANPQQSQPAARQAQSVAMSSAPSGIRVYPNPSNTQFTVDLSALQETSTLKAIQLIDGLGRRIREIPLLRGNTIQVLETSHLPSGLYFVRALFDNGKPVIQKVIIQH